MAAGGVAVGAGGAGARTAIGGPFLPVAEVARRMRVSKMTVYRMVHRGELPAVRSGRALRVQRAAVDRLLAGTRRRAG